jgi:hypothetical protein
VICRSQLFSPSRLSSEKTGQGRKRRIQKSDSELFLQSRDHLLVLLVFEEYGIGIGDREASAALETALILGNDMEMKVRVGITVGAEVDLCAAPKLFDGAGSSCQICRKIGSLLICALAEFFLMSLQSQSAAALVCLIFEKIKDAGLHFTDFKHNSFAAFMVFITVKASHLNTSYETK